MGDSQGVKRIDNPEGMQSLSRKIHKEGKSIGLVPTMGYFHQGHVSLMEAARRDTDIVVVSLFVNPTQFGPSEDYERYPRDFERDVHLASQAGVDIIFCPEKGAMYPEGFRTYVKVEGLSGVLCGASRQGHFQGVTTVVAKLFNIVKPDIAYFGQKDAQQSIIIRRMAEDLNWDIRIKVLPTVREGDGLAMSSRNVYLSTEERKAALCLFKAITGAEALFKEGAREAHALLDRARAIIDSEPLATLEYISICSLNDLAPLERIEGEALLAIAVRIGKTRLIDNTILGMYPSCNGF